MKVKASDISPSAYAHSAGSELTVTSHNTVSFDKPIRPRPAVNTVQILLVEDNEGDFVLTRELLSEVSHIGFTSVGSYNLTRVASLSDSLKVIESVEQSIILLDLSLPDADGFDAFHRLQLAAPTTPIILLTGLDDFAVAKKAVYQGAQDFLTKGQIDANLLWRAILYAIERNRAEDERRRLEARLLRGQKLESLGVLAGGLAHDLNNLLQGVLNCSSLAMRFTQDKPLVHKHLDQIETLVGHAEEMINKLFNCAGDVKFDIERVNLTEFIHDMRQVFSATIPESVTLKYELAPNLPIVEIDPGQLRQVAINLVTNASEAIGNDHGTITMRTGVMKADQDYLTETYLDDDLPEGFYVYIEVSDTGGGIDVATKQRIFEPFFTTKTFGRGLGLASVLGIVRGYKGALKLDSENQSGAAFRVLLPCADQPSHARAI